jgi:hypothetical protein
MAVLLCTLHFAPPVEYGAEMYWETVQSTTATVQRTIRAYLVATTLLLASSVLKFEPNAFFGFLL